MTEIEQVKSDCVSCRRSEYVSVVNVLNNYNFIYKGDRTLTKMIKDIHFYLFKIN